MKYSLELEKLASTWVSGCNTHPTPNRKDKNGDNYGQNMAFFGPMTRLST